MSNKVGIKYPLEIKMKAIEMKQDGIPVKTIQEPSILKVNPKSMLGGIVIVTAIYIALNNQLENSIPLDTVLMVLLKKKYS